VVWPAVNSSRMTVLNEPYWLALNAMRLSATPSDCLWRWFASACPGWSPVGWFASACPEPAPRRRLGLAAV